ncbi:MAG TPA: hypothetical protein VMR86_08530 [Myxococcota bacterium]|nr:hypothetical protein [Myxococcota bacterium]
MIHNLDPEYNQLWLDEFQGEDPWSRVSGTPALGTTFCGDEIVPWDELRRLEVHRGAFARVHWDSILCGVVKSDGTKCDYLTVARSHQRGPFQPAEERLMRRLVPHMVRAREMHERLSPLITRGNAWPVLVDQLPYGIALVDSEGGVHACNAAAKAILSAADGFTVRRGRLEAAMHDATRRLHHAILRASATSPVPSATVLALPRLSGRRPYQVLIAPIAGAQPRSLFGPQIVALAVICDPEAPLTARATALESLFDLTPALARLTAALASGRSIAEYANEAQVSEGTLRHQLKEIFRRTGTHRQTELVALVLSSIASLSGGLPSSRG